MSRKIACSRVRLSIHLRSAQFRGANGYLLRVAILLVAACLNVLVILWMGDPRITWYIAGLAIIVAVIVLWVRKSWNRIPATIRGSWKSPYVFSCLAIVVAVPALIGGPVALHQKHITANTTGPEEGRPWREGLAARVWWQELPTQEMERGLADTAEALGITYERVESVDHANLRVWLGSWAYNCKWLGPYAFVSLEPSPSVCGGQTADIYVCRLTTPFKDRQLSDRTIIAHETGHIFAAQPHFGDGLMADGGGTYAHWFTDEEIEAMRARMSEFRASIKPECADPP